MSARPEVIEAYRDYVAPFDVRRSVSRLLGIAQEREVQGVRAVVLTNLDALTRQARRRKSKSRGRKVGVDQIAGRYHQAWNGEQAWIELFVDQILSDFPRWVLGIPPVREMVLGDTLFHELGHHIHKTQAPVYREQEDVADAWSKRLRRRYFSKVYWYLVPFVLLLVSVGKLARRVRSLGARVTKRKTTARR